MTVGAACALVEGAELLGGPLVELVGARLVELVGAPVEECGVEE
jgi:hypothetical protein